MDPEFVTIIWWVSVILFIIVDWCAADTMGDIAAMKGHPQRKYCWWCFLMPIFGYPMVIALPDRRGTQTQSAPNADELPDI